MSVNDDFISFHEYYLYQEAFSDSVDDAKKSMMYFLKRFRMLITSKNKKQDLIQILSELKKDYKYFYDKIMNFVYDIVYRNKKDLTEFSKILLLIVLNLILVGRELELLKTYLPPEKIIELIREHQAKVKTELKDIENSVEEKTSSNTETEKETNEIIERLNYGRFEDRKGFVDRIKVYEAGDYNKPNVIPPPLKAYRDRTQSTIGYGTKANEGETELSTTEAHNRLIDELTKIENELIVYLKSKNLDQRLTKDQISGLTDFAFNRGPNKLKQLMDSSKSLEDLTNKMKEHVMMRSSNSDKLKPSSNLKHRRDWETSLILKQTTI